MKILHLCLSNLYVDGYSYQENQLVAQNVNDGHDVLIVASTETYDAKGLLHYVEPSKYMGFDGATVIRLAYRKWLPHYVMTKLRMNVNVTVEINKFKPDVVLFHGTCGWELLAVSKYINKNLNVKLYVDSHEDKYNSARNFLSKYLLHKIYYKFIINRALPNINKILCLSVEVMQFVQDIYNIKSEYLEFYPLGGNIYEDIEYKKLRNDGINRFNLNERNVVFCQTGKMDATKKLVEALTAFTATISEHWRFVIAGVVQPDIKLQVEKLIANDARIQYVGWLSSQDLTSLLCAADVYVQPGTQSATMQMSLCCRCVVVIDDVPSHQPFMNDNGWLINQFQSLEDIFAKIELSEAKLPNMSRNSAAIAAKLLDYKKLAARLYR